MRQSYNEIIHYESGWRLQAMFRRMSQVRQIFPWLRPGLSHAELRRAVARLRSGAMPSIDSRIPASYLADLLEGSIAQDLLVRETCADMQSFRELSEKLGRRGR
jgi:nitrate reductase beta subunit